MTAGDGLAPIEVTHASAGLRWQVLEVLDHWRHPEKMQAEGPIVTEVWRMRVAGPLPSAPGERGEFVMTARGYADRPYCWVAPQAL